VGDQSVCRESRRRGDGTAQHCRRRPGHQEDIAKRTPIRPPPIGHHTPCAAAIVARCPLPPSLATGKFTGEQYRAEALTRLCTPTPDR